MRRGNQAWNSLEQNEWMGLLTLYDVRVGHLLIRANVSLAIASNNDERIVK